MKCIVQVFEKWEEKEIQSWCTVIRNNSTYFNTKGTYEQFRTQTNNNILVMVISRVGKSENRIMLWIHQSIQAVKTEIKPLLKTSYIIKEQKIPMI